MSLHLFVIIRPGESGPGWGGGVGGSSSQAVSAFYLGSQLRRGAEGGHQGQGCVCSPIPVANPTPTRVMGRKPPSEVAVGFKPIANLDRRLLSHRSLLGISFSPAARAGGRGPRIDSSGPASAPSLGRRQKHAVAQRVLSAPRSPPLRLWFQLGPEPEVLPDGGGCSP